MRRSRFWFFLFVFLALYFFMPALNAAPPQNTLVMANQIDDIITLDPAEVFEFSGAEYAANVYDRLRTTYPPDHVEDLQGDVAESSPATSRPARSPTPPDQVEDLQGNIAESWQVAHRARRRGASPAGRGRRSPACP